jgi:hypothetical protein
VPWGALRAGRSGVPSAASSVPLSMSAWTDIGEQFVRELSCDSFISAPKTKHDGVESAIVYSPCVASLLLFLGIPAPSQDRARIVFDCRMANDAIMIPSADSCNAMAS